MKSSNIVPFDGRHLAKATDAHFLGRRGAERAGVTLPAKLHTGAECKTVNLINLSTTGAMVEGIGLPQVGHDVVLKCLTLEIMGVVIWIGNGRCGIHFDQSIPQEEVRRHWFEGLRAARSSTATSED